ncbi:hypothetical protein G6F65_019702 [Rhizopus arrhizus]|nr:hypothetical protein G6F65_019702 [Rhizopus arrhizus]
MGCAKGVLMVPRHRVQETQEAQNRPDRRGQYDQPQCGAQRAFWVHPAAQQQPQAQQRVGQQDVALIEEHGMRQAQQRQPRQPPQEARRERRLAAFGRRHLQGEAIAEQEREQQIELGFEQPRDQPAHRQIHRAGIGRIGHSCAVERRRENADVHDQNAKERKPAQRVHVGQAAGGLTGVAHARPLPACGRRGARRDPRPTG